MSFIEGLSGLNAASEQLSVLGKNIANSATVGYKSASIDFTNVLASHLNSANSGMSAQTGGGVLASNVTQSFSQGAINNNTSPLNAAISGQGMFALYDPILDQTSYTRNGQFTQNSTGYLVNGSGFQVLDVSGSSIDLSTYEINPDSVQTYQVDTVVFSKPLSPYGTVTFGGLTYTNTDGNTIGTVVAPTINSTTTGTSLVAEVDSAAFNSMSAGDAVTVGGLRFVANQDLTATQAASAFASLSAGATTGPGTSYGSYTGKFSSTFTSGVNNSGTVVFTATSVGVQSAIAASAVQSGVAAIFSGLLAGDTPATIAARSAASVANGGAANYALTSGIFAGVLGDFNTSSPAASTTTSTDVLTTGTASVTQIEKLTFSAINTGDTYSAGGLTFTASSDITAAELAATFYSKINDSTSTSIYGSWSGTVTSGSGGATGLGSATMNGTTAVNWSYAGNGVVSTGLISGLLTTNGMPSSYLGVELSASELANDAAVTVTHTNYGSETAIAVSGSGFLSGSNPFVKTTTEGTDIAYLNTMAIDTAGTIIGTYTDGSTYELGQIGVALIPSNVGLKALGNDSWIETEKSGAPVIAAANTLGRGTVIGSALEASNVNQTTDMVGLLAAQQAYQASAQVIKIQSQDYQTLLGMNG
jgi:flagellar hook-basal body protein